MSATRVKCPTCGRDLEWSAASPWRPFCSERCRLLDLGAWLNDQRAVPGEKLAGEAHDPEQDRDADSAQAGGRGEPR
jgi:endogenous inhibitor of DNA gyrase (YacG/DUF329 family)